VEMKLDNGGKHWWCCVFRNEMKMKEMIVNVCFEISVNGDE